MGLPCCIKTLRRKGCFGTDRAHYREVEDEEVRDDEFDPEIHHQRRHNDGDQHLGSDGDHMQVAAVITIMTWMFPPETTSIRYESRSPIAHRRSRLAMFIRFLPYGPPPAPERLCVARDGSGRPISQTVADRPAISQYSRQTIGLFLKIPRL